MRRGWAPLSVALPACSPSLPVPGFQWPRTRCAAFRGDVQGDADSNDDSGNSPHHRGSGDDIGEPPVGWSGRVGCLLAVVIGCNFDAAMAQLNGDFAREHEHLRG